MRVWRYWEQRKAHRELDKSSKVFFFHTGGTDIRI